MFEERWSEAAEAYRRYCELETDVSNKIVLNSHFIKYLYFTIS